MGERRENIKKTLGITEYPWSSDDDDTETPGGNEMQQQHSGGDEARASVADNPGTSGQQNMSGASSLSGREQPRPHSMFWSVPVMGSRRTPTLTLHRSRAVTRDDMPLSLVSRPAQSAGAATGSADVQRILAFRKINRQHGRYLSRGPPIAMRHALQLRRRNATALSANRFESISRLQEEMAARTRSNSDPEAHGDAENRSNNINRYPVHANPSVTTAMALRRARAIAEMDFTNSNVSVQDYHDALLRADLAEALRSYEQPSTSRPEHAEQPQPSIQPANLGPPHDVIEALSEQMRNDTGINNAQQSMQPVNLSHPDDSFLEDEQMDQEIRTGEENETSDVAIQHNEHDISIDQYENDNENPVEEAANESANTDAAEGGGDDTVDGENDGDGDAAMSLEEVVEIDAEEPEPAAATPQSVLAQIESAEPVANTSAANDETAVILPHRIKRKGDSDDDNNELGTVKEFNQSLLRLLECPVCLEWMEPPMWQCRRGHLVCGRCRARLAACPVCRTAFSSVRNRAMEGVAEMLRYPCRHGCGRDLQLRRRSTHEASCVARRYRCPAPQCDTRPPIAHKDLATHFQSKHLSMVKLGHAHTFNLRVNSEQHDNWIILALNQLFHLRVDVDIRTWGVVVYVAYIGPKCYADDYTYEVSVTGQHNSRKLVYSRATHCDLECSSLNMSRQDCFHLTLEQALNFLRVRNRSPEPAKYLHFSVNIARSEVTQEEDN